MKKQIILLFCCGVLVSIAGCGSNTAPPPTASPPTTVSETLTMEMPTETTPLVTAIQPTEKANTAVTNTAEEKVTLPIDETVESTTPQPTESETLETEPAKEEPKEETEPTEKPALFDIDYWIAYARNYAESKGLVLSDTAVECWDNPIRAGAHCIYLERDVQSRLNRYAKDEDITDVWIWAEATGNDCYDIYIGYA